MAFLLSSRVSLSLAMAARLLINPTFQTHARHHLVHRRSGRSRPSLLPLSSIQASKREVNPLLALADSQAAKTLQHGVGADRFQGLLQQLSDELHDKFSIPKSRGLFESLGFIIIMEQPAIAATAAPVSDDWIWTWISWGIVALWYFFIMPPIIFNWLRLRWYKRKLLEMYVQFMCVFLFFPSLVLWAPFLNFRQLPRDPSTEYPWSTPQETSAKDSASSS